MPVRVSSEVDHPQLVQEFHNDISVSTTSTFCSVLLSRWLCFTLLTYAHKTAAPTTTHSPFQARTRRECKGQEVKGILFPFKASPESSISFHPITRAVSPFFIPSCRRGWAMPFLKTVPCSLKEHQNFL